MNELGQPVDKQLLLDLFEPDEGTVNFYYGRIGNGKTYSATADILDLLRKGRVVYCNWKIDFSGFDEREHFMYAFFRWFMFKKRFYKFNKENLRYFSPDDVDIKFLGGLTDCEVFIDEGQWIFDSYKGTDFSVEKRKLILHTRHFNRSLNIISQRTQALHVTARGQVNRFFKCEKKLTYPFLVFKRTEFQDMKENDVDEEAEPISTKTYIANKRVLEAYNSKYMRSGVPKSQDVNFDAFDLNFWERTKLLLSFLRPRGRLKPARGEEKPGETLGDNSPVASIKTNTSHEKVMAILKDPNYRVGSIHRVGGGKVKMSFAEELQEDQQTLPF